MHKVYFFALGGKALSRAWVENMFDNSFEDGVHRWRT